MSDLGRTLRTVRHLRPGQVLHRIRLRGQKQLYPRVPEHRLVERLRVDTAAAPGWPSDFTPLDQQAPLETTTAEQIARGELTLVGETGTVTTPDDWNRADRSQLWRYHLHYFEWAWALVDEPSSAERFGELWRSWRSSHRVGQWDAWSPYVVAVRAWTLCALHRPLIAGSAVEHDVVESLRVHAGYLRQNLELDVGGNHLIKDLKGLAALGVFFQDDDLVDLATRHLACQIGVQVHADGGHYERSPSYHAQVLGDLIDTRGLLTAAGHPGPSALDAAIERMRHWLDHLLLPDDTVPLLKDCVPVPPARLRALGVDPTPSDDPCTVLADSGYVVVRVGRLHAVLDVGPPCPPSLPAHAHADSLNWVLSIDGTPAVVDTGVSTYQDLGRRAEERSTSAHNTVEIDGEDSTEVYGSFRAGRRASVRLLATTADADRVEVTAEHDGYRHLDGNPVHRRTWTITTDGVSIRDQILGAGPHHVRARTHTLGDTVAVEHPGNPTEKEPVQVACGMGTTVPAVCHTTDVRAQLPATVETRIVPTERSSDVQDARSDLPD